MRLIEIPEWGTVNLIEAVWLFSGLLAFACAALRAHPLVSDYRIANSIGEKDLNVIARGYMRREFIRLAQASIIIAIGAYGAHEPSALPGPARVSTTGLIITAGLISISFFVSLQSVLDWRDREKVNWILESRP